MTLFAPTLTLPALTIPDDASEAADLVRPVLVAGGEPPATVILIDVDARGGGS